MFTCVKWWDECQSLTFEGRELSWYLIFTVFLSWDLGCVHATVPGRGQNEAMGAVYEITGYETHTSSTYCPASHSSIQFSLLIFKMHTCTLQISLNPFHYLLSEILNNSNLFLKIMKHDAMNVNNCYATMCKVI